MLPSILKRGFAIFNFALLLLLLFLPGYAKLRQLRDKNAELETKLKSLNIENTLLQQELRRVENDPLYQEKIAREKMGVVRKGEIPIKVVPERRKK